MKKLLAVLTLAVIVAAAGARGAEEKIAKKAAPERNVRLTFALVPQEAEVEEEEAEEGEDGTESVFLVTSQAEFQTTSYVRFEEEAWLFEVEGLVEPLEEGRFHVSFSALLYEGDEERGEGGEGGEFSVTTGCVLKDGLELPVASMGDRVLVVTARRLKGE